MAFKVSKKLQDLYLSAKYKFFSLMQSLKSLQEFLVLKKPKHHINNMQETLRERKQNLLSLKAASSCNLNSMKGGKMMIFFLPTHSQVNSKRNSTSHQSYLRVPPNCSLFNFVEENRRVKWVSSKSGDVRIADSYWAEKAFLVNFYLKLRVTSSVQDILKGQSWNCK